MLGLSRVMYWKLMHENKLPHPSVNFHIDKNLFFLNLFISPIIYYNIVI
jgi:hypothetical protein